MKEIYKLVTIPFKKNCSRDGVAGLNERKREVDLNMHQGEVALDVAIWSPPTSCSGVFFRICPEGVFPGGLLSAPLLNLVGNLASTPFFQASPRSEQEGQEENTVSPKAPVGVS